MIRIDESECQCVMDDGIQRSKISIAWVHLAVRARGSSDRKHAEMEEGSCNLRASARRRKIKT